MNKRARLFSTIVALLLAITTINCEPVHAAIKSSLTSKKVDTKYFTTIKEGDYVWYQSNQNSREDTGVLNYLNFGINYFDGYSIGNYSVIDTKLKIDYSHPTNEFLRAAILEYSTGNIVTLPVPYNIIVDVCEDEKYILAKGTNKMAIIPKSGNSGNLTTYAYFDFKGNKVSKIDYLEASEFVNGYALVSYYKNGEKVLEAIDKDFNTVCEIPYTKKASWISGVYAKCDGQCYNLQTGKQVERDDVDEYLSKYYGKPGVNRKEFDSFVKNEAAKWDEYEYLGYNRFLVRGHASDNKDVYIYYIVDSKGKMILEAKGNEAVLNTCLIVEDEPYFLTYTPEDSKKDVRNAYYRYYAIYDKNGKKIVGYDHKYGQILPCDGGFLCGTKRNSKEWYLQQEIVNTKGKVVTSANFNKEGVLHTFYNGRAIDMGYEYYVEWSVPSNAVWVLSGKYKGITNNIKTDFMKDNVNYIHVYDDEQGYPAWESVTKLYKSLLKKSSGPAFLAWNCFTSLTIREGMSTEYFADALPYIGVNKKGKASNFADEKTICVACTDSNEINISWSDDYSPYYKIEYGTKEEIDSNKPRSVIENSESTSLKYSDGEKEYLIRIISLDKDKKETKCATEYKPIKLKDNSKRSSDIKVNFTSIKANSDGTANLTWNLVEGADAYVIRYTKKGDESELETVVKNSNTTTLDMPKIDQQYQFQIKAIDEDEADLTYFSDKSDWYFFGLYPAKIKSVKSTEPKTAIIKWEEVPGAAKYQIAFAKNILGAHSDSKKVSGTKTSLKISLSADVSYIFKVRALDKDGKELSRWSEWSSPCKIMKGSGKEKCEFTSLVSPYKKAITCRWTKVDGATKYEIRYKRASVTGDGTKKTISTQTETSKTIVLKYDDVDYVFKIRALDSKGNALTDWSDWSNPVHIK